MKNINAISEHSVKLGIVALFLIGIFLPLTLFAQGSGVSSGGSGSANNSSPQGIHDPGTGLEDPDMKDATQQQLRDPDCIQGTDCDPIQDRDQDRIQDPTLFDGTGPDRDQTRDQIQDQDCVAGTDCDPIQDQDRDRLQIHTPDELRNAIQEQQRLLLDVEEGVGEQVQQIYRNQNQVRVAAMALASSSDLLGPIGPSVSRIAQDFDNSVQATIQAEEQIQNRSVFARFFFGSDDDEVANLSGQLVQNQNRVQELNRLIESWDGDPQVQTILQEQIQNMEQEQLRLQQLVDEEDDSRGLFGFLFGWL